MGIKTDIRFLLRPNLRDENDNIFMELAFASGSKLHGVSINQFALYAFTKELSELENSYYFRNFLKDRTKEEIIKGFDEVFGKVKKRNVEDWDEL